MSTEVTNSQIGNKVNYNGKDCEVVSTSAAYITVVDNNGNEISVRKTSSVFDFSGIVEANNKRIDRIDNKVAQYRQQEQLAKENAKGFKAKMRSMCSEWGVKFWHQMDSSQKAAYKGAKDDYYAARFDGIAASNRERSALLDKFNLVLDNAKYIS